MGAQAQAGVLLRARPHDLAPQSLRERPRREAPPAAVGEAQVTWRERAFLIVAVLGQQDAFFNVLRVLRGQDGAIAPAPSDPMNFAVVAATLLGMALLIPRHREPVLQVVRANGAIVLLCVLVLLSAVWSVAPGLSLKRSVVHLNTVLVALYMGSRLDLEEALRCVALAIGAAAVASLACCVALPFIGVMNTPGLEGKWRGVYTHKNELGQAMAIGLVAQAYLVVRGRRLWAAAFALQETSPAAGRLSGAALLALEALLVIKAGSATALTVAFVSLGTCSVLLLARRGGLPAKAMLAIGPAATLGTAALLALFPILLTKVSGKDATLTGRTELWAGVVQAIHDRPWLGYGFQAFWSGADPHAVEIWRIIRWNAPNAHNGYLEVMLGLGLVGLAATVVVVLQALVRAVRLLLDGDTFQAGAVTLALAGAIAIETFTEAVLVQQSDIDWFLLLLISFASSRLILARRRPLLVERRVLSRARPEPAVALAR